MQTWVYGLCRFRYVEQEQPNSVPCSTGKPLFGALFPWNYGSTLFESWCRTNGYPSSPSSSSLSSNHLPCPTLKPFSPSASPSTGAAAGGCHRLYEDHVVFPDQDRQREWGYGWKHGTQFQTHRPILSGQFPLNWHTWRGCRMVYYGEKPVWIHCTVSVLLEITELKIYTFILIDCINYY